MPYGNRMYTSRRRNTRRGRRGYTRTTGRYGRYNGTPGREVKFIDKVINSFSTSITGTNLFAAGEDTLIDIAQDTGQSQRIGRKIIITKILLRYRILQIQATNPANTSDVVRTILYIDRQANGTPATIGILLTSSNIDKFRDLDHPNRFKVLMDSTTIHNSTAGGGDGTTEDYAENTKYYTKFFNVRIPVFYNGATGAVTEIGENNLCLSVISFKAKTSWSGTVRIRYIG